MDESEQTAVGKSGVTAPEPAAPPAKARSIRPLVMIWRQALNYPGQVALALVALAITAAATLAKATIPTPDARAPATESSAAPGYWSLPAHTPTTPRRAGQSGRRRQ